jgi:hypothetical protein
MPNISTEKVCYVIVKAREFHVKEAVVEIDVGSNPADEGMREVLADYADDPTYEELKTFLSNLNQEEIVNLLALAWMGRGDFTADDWESLVQEAQEIVDEKAPDYLIGMPLLADYLEEALSQLGFSCEDFELAHQ